MLRARVERWWPDLLGGLTAVYGAERAPLLGADLVELAATAFSVRADRLHVRDLERMLRPDWLQDPADDRLRGLHRALRRTTCAASPSTCPTSTSSACATCT